MGCLGVPTRSRIPSVRIRVPLLLLLLHGVDAGHRDGGSCFSLRNPHRSIDMVPLLYYSTGLVIRASFRGRPYSILRRGSVVRGGSVLLVDRLTEWSYLSLTLSLLLLRVLSLVVGLHLDFRI